MSQQYSEDTLAQQTTADYLRDSLGWETVYAYNEETFGADGTLGRENDREVVLTRPLRVALEKLNPGLPREAYEAAVHQLAEASASKTMLQLNREKYLLCRNGVTVPVRMSDGRREEKRLRVFDFDTPENNHFLAVRELWVRGRLYRRRPDIVGFVNGLPLVFFELKNIHRDIRRGYEENLTDYKDTVPELFSHNALIVLSNGEAAKLGAVSSKWGHFHEWKRLAEEDTGVVDLETLLKGVCSKGNLLDLFENFILFDESSGRLVKIVARNHQFLGVNRAVQAVRDRTARHGQLGTFWHTQGSGKSYSMVFFSEKVHRKLPGSFSFLIVTDRDELDGQIYKTYAGCGVVAQQPEGVRAASGLHLREVFTGNQPYLFTMIHKFNQEVRPEDAYSLRDDIIVISDEAHRTQYGRLALNMRNALPNAHYIGFTGTPLFKSDEITRQVFGDYVSTYDFQRAVDDEATVPLFYENRGDKLGITTEAINERLAEKLEELSLDPDQEAKLEQMLQREYHIITAAPRLDRVARDFVEHYSTRWESGKAMVVCIDKVTAGRVMKLAEFYWDEKTREVEAAAASATDEAEMIFLQRKAVWMRETRMALIVSEEQNEVKRFAAWDLDIERHRKLMKAGFEVESEGTKRPLAVDEAFKDGAHPFRVAFVCAMWLTGFDVPSLATLYLDKPLRAHTLMQAIARANRVNEGKNNGLIVDYCGILKSLRAALATFAGGGTGGGDGGDSPVRPEEELLAALVETLTAIRTYLGERGFDLSKVIDSTGFARNAAIVEAKNVLNTTEETRKRFEIIAREMFKKFKACLTIRAVNDHRAEHDVVDIIYKKLQTDRDAADITDVLKQLQDIVDEHILPTVAETPSDAGKVYDISRIDFEKLKREFARHPQRNTAAQCLKTVVEKRLAAMLARNPARANFYRTYQDIIAGYNTEKDRITIEETFAALLRFVESLDAEDARLVGLGLDEEHAALFDILAKRDLLDPKNARLRERVKSVAAGLLAKLKTEKLQVDNWRAKDATRAEVRTTILDFLYDDTAGLPPESYSLEEVDALAERVFQHIYDRYDGPEPPLYHAA